MKKLAIAGASVALAAMPIVSTFAATTVTDHLTVTVNEQCELGTTVPAADATTGAIDGYWYATVNPGDSATAFTAGTASASSGGEATSIEIHCNAAEGYKITPTFTALDLTGATDDTQDITYGGAATPVAGTWTAYYQVGNQAATPFAASGTPVTGDPSMTDVYTFSYKVTPGVDQAAGKYTGTATYVLAKNS